MAAAYVRRFAGLVRFGTYASEIIESVDPRQEPEKLWPVYGVNNQEGVVFSHWQKGADFNSNYRRIRKDWFFHNPTRANVGSLGRVPEVEADAITSPEYQVWRVTHPDWSPDFAEILIRLPFFSDLIQVHRVGAVKQRLFARNLLSIPVPPLTATAQADVVKLWKSRLSEALTKEGDAKRIEDEAVVEFLKAHGFSVSDRGKAPRCFAATWQTMERWGVDANQQRSHGLRLKEGRYPVSPLGTLLRNLQYGTSQKANTQKKGIPVLRMNNIVNGRMDMADLKHVVLDARDEARWRLQNGDLLINRTNSKELVGKCAVYKDDMEAVFASYLIRLQLDEAVIDPEYLSWILNGPIGRQQIDAISRQIIGQANINSGELRSIEVPVPPPTIQKELVRGLKSAQAASDQLRARAHGLRERASFEAQELIFKQVEASTSTAKPRLVKQPR